MAISMIRAYVAYSIATYSDGVSNDMLLFSSKPTCVFDWGLIGSSHEASKQQSLQWVERFFRLASALLGFLERGTVFASSIHSIKLFFNEGYIGDSVTFCEKIREVM